MFAFFVLNLICAIVIWNTEVCTCSHTNVLLRLQHTDFLLEGHGEVPAFSRIQTLYLDDCFDYILG
jgi:hypothetical protein